ncbi:folylpolyglutamate synthase/dihydrofolate synthase family protein [soil metagenome]
MRALLRRLGDPQRSLRGALIGGTNGKGSTQEMVAAMLRAGGLVVGQAPSPHLSDYGERIVVDAQAITLTDLDALLWEVIAASLLGERRHGPATEFELLMAAAFAWFARQRVEVTVVEVGLGGRLDASNTWAAGVAAITNVGLDHQEYLGSTLRSIAHEKAAIIKRGDRAVTGATGEALRVIHRRAARLGVPLTECQPLVVERMEPAGMLLRDPRLGPLRLPLLGRHQAQNAAVALATIEALGEGGIARAGDDAQRRGLERVRWPGRMEVLHGEGITIVLDGAHNPDGAAALAATLDELRATLPGSALTLLLGILRDKEVADVLSALTGSDGLRTARLVATGVPDSDRSLDAASLARAWASLPGTQRATLSTNDVEAALTAALRIARAEGGTLVVTGSLYLVGHVRASLMSVGAYEPPDA